MSIRKFLLAGASVLALGAMSVSGDVALRAAGMGGGVLISPAQAADDHSGGKTGGHGVNAKRAGKGASKAGGHDDHDHTDHADGGDEEEEGHSGGKGHSVETKIFHGPGVKGTARAASMPPKVPAVARKAIFSEICMSFSAI